MDPNTIKYLDAYKRFAQLTNALNDAASLLNEFVVGVHKDIGMLFFENCQVRAPSDVTVTSRRPGINAAKWPSADQLQTMLNGWFEAKRLAQNLYGHVPQDEKALVPKMP